MWAKDWKSKLQYQVMWWLGYTVVKQASRDVWRIASLLSQSSIPTCLGVNGSATPGLGLGPRWLSGGRCCRRPSSDTKTPGSAELSAHLLMKEADSKFGISLPVSWNNADTGKHWLYSSHSWINKTCPIKYGMKKNCVKLKGEFSLHQRKCGR